MGLFKRADDTKGIVTGENLLSQIKPDKAITTEEAMMIPSVAACVQFITEKVAELPLKLYQKKENKETEEVFDDYRVQLLNKETHDTLTAYEMRRAWVMDYLLSGCGNIFVDWWNNEIRGLYYVDSRNISIAVNTDVIKKSYRIYVQGKEYHNYQFLRILRMTQDGMFGRGIIKMHQEPLALAYKAMVLERSLLTSGGGKKGFLTSQKKLTQEVLDVLKAAWKRLYTDPNENVQVLNEGLDFKDLSTSPTEMQLNENKITNSDEICKLFLLSPGVTNGTATSQQIADAIMVSVIPILVEIENVLNRSLLLESEKDKLYFAHDTKELLKGDIEKRYRAYKIALESHFMQVDEVRYRENLPALDFNYIRLGLQDVLYNPKTKEIYTPNTNKVTNLEEGGTNIETGNTSGREDDN